ncbi:MAG: hypothetical protein M0Z55_01740 [Peptococcaceae bacterium]|nr:hypothetical protein [Peptococcaceae bacterium]
MLQGSVNIVCKCGQIHTNADTIIFRRDPVANRVKSYCRRCSRRIYLVKVTSDTAAHRKQLHEGRHRTDSL